MRDLIARSGERVRTLSLLYHDASAKTAMLATMFARYAMQISPTEADQSFLIIRDPAYRLLGGISDDAWRELKSGATLPVGRLGITDEMRALLASEAHATRGEQPVSDLKHHPAELYDRDPIEATSISFRPSEKTVMRSQNPRGDLSTWESPAMFARSLGGAAVNRLSGFQSTPATQEVFEQRITDRVRDVNEHAARWQWSFQTALETISTINLHLPYGQRIEFVWSSIQDQTPLGAFLDLPKTVRDELYKGAVEADQKELTRLRNGTQENQPLPARTIPP